MLTIRLAPGFAREQKYILSVLLEEFLGLAFGVEEAPNEGRFVSISAEGKTLLLEQRLFCGDEASLLAAESLPAQPLPLLDAEAEGLSGDLLCDDTLPIIFGGPGQEGRWITRSKNETTIHADLLGSSFFMLSRLEEAIGKDRDLHGRFPAVSSLAHRERFLERPIVNEYLEILWAAMQELWPGLRCKQRSFSLAPTHDLDRPFSYQPFRAATWVRSMAGDLIKRHQPGRALSGLLNGTLAAAGLAHNDPLDTFGWLMDHSESCGARSTFYFMAGGDTTYDGGYSLGHKRIRMLAREMSRRGHKIGLHPSYRTVREPARLEAEVSALLRLLADERIDQAEIGARQHYLRWEAPATWQLYEDKGISDDSSVFFADEAGFRCGVCYDYPVFNVHTRERLKLVEKPLLVMDGTLFQEDHMDLDHDSARLVVARIRRNVERYQGVFRVLWHNSWFARGEEERCFYEWVTSGPHGRVLQN